MCSGHVRVQVHLIQDDTSGMDVSLNDFFGAVDMRWSVCISCLVPFVRQIWAAVGMESSKIHRTEHSHLSHLDTEHMVYLISTCLPHKMSLTNLSWLWFYLNNEFTKAEMLTQFSYALHFQRWKKTLYLIIACLNPQRTEKRRLRREGANVNSSTRNRTRRASLLEPCQHITEASGVGGGEGNCSIWNKISPRLEGI